MSAPVADVERMLPAPCHVVYDEWLSVEALSEWMCPRPSRLRRVQLDPVVGGQLRFDIVEGDRELVVVGSYLVLERPHLLKFTWSCSTWPEPAESTVTVELRPEGHSGTRMTIRHELVPPDTIASHTAGWRRVTDQLAEHVSRLAAGR